MLSRTCIVPSNPSHSRFPSVLRSKPRIRPRIVLIARFLVALCRSNGPMELQLDQDAHRPPRTRRVETNKNKADERDK